MVLRDDSTVFSPRIKKQKALKKLEDKVALMEASWEEFCLLVKLFVDLHRKKTKNTFMRKYIQFPGAYHQCELAAREAGKREKEVLYKRKAFEAAAAISEIFEKTLLDLRNDPT